MPVLRFSVFGLAGLVLGACGGEEPTASPGIGWAKGCSDIYADDLMPEFELEFAPDELEGLEQDCRSNTKQYRPVIFKYGSESVPAMARLKGNWSWRCDKKQFVVSFNETDAKARFHGVRKIVLDAAWYDPTLLGERLGMSFLHRYGVPSSCVNNARLTINGQYYGAYASAERLDKEYLQRHFPGDDADGNLYDGGQELRTNEDMGDVSRRDELFASVDSLSKLEELADLDEAVKVWAGLSMLPDVDSYWAGVEINYFLYDHPQRGFTWLPYDMDMTAPTGEFDSGSSSVAVGLVDRYVEADPFTYENPDWSKEPLFRTVLSNEAWCERFVQYLEGALKAYDVELMQRDLDRWSGQIAAAVEADPNRPFSLENHAQALETMKEFLQARRQFVSQWLKTASCPVNNW